MKNASHDWLLIADGEPLSAKKLRRLAQGKKILVLDGAYLHAKQSGLKIDILLGDFDAIHPDDLTEARKNILVIEAPNQNKTDLEKGIEYLYSIQAKNICIAAATGRRLQHTIFNIRILKKYHQNNRSLMMISETEIINYYQDTETEITGHSNDNIALLGFPEGTITTSGLKYDVINYLMQFEKCSSISNSLVNKKAKIKIRGGVLIIHETNNH